MKIVIISAEIELMSTIGTILYEAENGKQGSIYMDHRCFWDFIRGVGEPAGKIYEYDGEGLLPMEVSE